MGLSPLWCAAAPANKIVAQPGTVTGSIGVAFGKWNVTQALKDHGVSFETISVGDHTDPNSDFLDHTEVQVKGMKARIDR